METLTVSSLLMDNSSNTYHQPMHDIEWSSQVYKNFIFGDTYASSHLDPHVRNKLKLEAFKVVQTIHEQLYDTCIDSCVQYNEDGIVVMRDQQCAHHMIDKIHRVVRTLQHIALMPEYQYNMFIFLPYMKQLHKTISLFQNDYCCSKLVQQCIQSLNVHIRDAEKILSLVNNMQNRLNIMCIFDSKPFYHCNICQESSLDVGFLKANTCCGYSMCNACYAKLWQYSSLFPVCPVCKTSFKNSNSGNSSKHESSDNHKLFTPYGGGDETTNDDEISSDQ
ncbi:Immediate early protein 0 [Perigonia lusca single nucleopolyhedrovirus]|uniref:Immediate early protein 0 n=1 Tax=Perigonia lusca single nucleopolyhedrovirus TaxID=1675865 RepID=A0A0M3WNB3_9ABAC|nr:Immediate early protein 0 [Perigonia lusca single nucleopolyhedrovirus]AKN80552.1 Immediate early protein 0 [Perigonia lusca single nucleopolyhedrovirus]